MGSSAFGEGALQGLHPRKLAENQQRELEGVLVGVAPEINQLNENLAAETDKTRQVKMTREGVSALDKKWPFNEHQFLVSGWLAGPMPEVTLESIDLNYAVRRETFTTATSLGFEVQMHDQNQPPRVGLLFNLGRHAISASYLRGMYDVLAVGALDDLSLTYLAPPKPSNEQLVQQSTAALLEANATLRQAYTKPNSEFFRLGHAEQQAFVGTLIEEVTNATCAEAYPSYVLAEVPFVYVRQPDQQRRFFRRVAVPEGKLAGWVETASVLELQKLDTAPLARKRELLDPDAGICLVCRLPNADEVAKFGATDVFIPTGRCRSLKLPNMEYQ